MNMTNSMDHLLPRVGLQGALTRCGRRVAGLAGCARTLSVAAALGLLLPVACGGDACAQGTVPAKEPRPKDRVVAKVNGMPIYASDLDAMAKAQERMLQAQFANDPARLRKEMAEVKRTALNGLIDFQLMADEFFRLGGVINKEDIENDEMQVTQHSFRGDHAALMAEINAIGMSFDKYRELRERMIIVSAVRARITNKIEVTDEMVRQHYEKNRGRWGAPEAAKFHTLTIRRTSANARRQAEILRTRLVNGGDFAQIARENSKDSRADDGGAWPWTDIADINDRVGGVIAKMKRGEISAVIEEPDTLIILRVDELRESDPKPFESVAGEVRKSLMEELAKERIEKRLCRLREEADIQRMGPV